MHIAFTHNTKRKPFGIEQLLFVVEKAVQLQKLQSENQELKSQLAGKFRFENMVFKSKPMEELLETSRKVAQSDATVLILGESGTGKELLARALHFNSPRRTKPRK